MCVTISYPWRDINSSHEDREGESFLCNILFVFERTRKEVLLEPFHVRALGEGCPRWEIMPHDVRIMSMYNACIFLKQI